MKIIFKYDNKEYFIKLNSLYNSRELIECFYSQYPPKDKESVSMEYPFIYAKEIKNDRLI